MQTSFRRLGIGSYDKSAFFEEILEQAKEQNKCIGCNRDIKGREEMSELEKYVSELGHFQFWLTNHLVSVDYQEIVEKVQKSGSDPGRA